MSNPAPPDAQTRLSLVLEGPSELLLGRIRKVLASNPRNIVVLNAIMSCLRKSETLKPDQLVQCVVAMVTDALSGVAPNQPESSQLFRVFSNALFIILEKSAPVTPTDAARLCRYLSKIFPAPLENTHTAMLLKLLKESIFTSKADYKTSHVQEAALWYTWLHLQIEQYAKLRYVNLTTSTLRQWNPFSFSVLQIWSTGLKTTDRRLACRFVCTLLRVALQSEKCIFTLLTVLKLDSPLTEVLNCVADRRFDEGLTLAEAQGVLIEYATVLTVYCPYLITRFEKEKKNLLRSAYDAFSILKCFIKAKQFPFETVLLLLRHVIYNRGLLDAETMPKLSDLICTLQEILPFDDLEHKIWSTDALAKIASNIIIVLKESKDHVKKAVLGDLCAKILVNQLSRFPKSETCLGLLCSFLIILECAVYVEEDRSSAMMFAPSPKAIAAVLQLYGPDRIDPLLLTVCVSGLKSQGAHLCDQLPAKDPQIHKWLSLELYALLRLSAGANETSYVREKLSEYNDVAEVSRVLTVLNLRAQALEDNQLFKSFASGEYDEGDVLIEANLNAIRFGQRHFELSEAVSVEIEQSKALMKMKAETGHEKTDQFEKSEFNTSLPMAFTSLCLKNLAELTSYLNWMLSHYKRFKDLDYWVLLSSFVFDNVRAAIAFHALNGDLVNQLKMLTLLGLLLKKSNAPATLIIDHQLRTADALVMGGCVENADEIIKNIKGQIESAELYCEDFFYFEAKLERLRLWAVIERNEPKPPGNLDLVATPIRAPSYDKIRLYAMSKFFHGKAIHQWNLSESGNLVATDALDSALRNATQCINVQKKFKNTMMPWELLDITCVKLLVETCKIDSLFELGSIRETMQIMVESFTASQIVFSFYYILRHMEQLTRITLYFGQPIDSKMAIISGLLDSRRSPASAALPVADGAPGAEEPFDLRTKDSIPYTSAMTLKLKQLQVASANSRIPPKEFLKFSERRAHKVGCKCCVCYSVGIALTLKKVDAITAHITRKAVVAEKEFVFSRILASLTNLLSILELRVRHETVCERATQRAAIRHAFSLAQGHADGGDFDAALKLLPNDASLPLNAKEQLELQLRKFEYTYQMSWRDALDILQVETNSPVQLIRPNPDSSAFKTPAFAQRPVAKNVRGRRGVRILFEEGGQGLTCNDEPATKRPTPEPGVKEAHIPEVAPKHKPKPPMPRTRRAAAAAKFPEDSDRPKFVPAEDSSGRVSRRRKAEMVLPRFETCARKTETIDDLFDEDHEISLSASFSKMNFRDRLRKPKTMDECNAELEFQALLAAGRQCAANGSQALFVDLFLLLAFLSAHRRKQNELIFYLEKSVGVGVQLAALNRGSRMKELFKAASTSEYFEHLRLRVDYEEGWHEKLWDYCCPDWTIVHLCAITEGGETPGLIVTRYEEAQQPKVVFLSAGHDVQFQGSFLRNFDSISRLNQTSLKVKERSAHWQQRKQADALLSEFSSALESTWVGCWKGMLLGRLRDSQQRKSLATYVNKVLEWAKLRKLQVKEGLLSVGLSALNSLTQEQLVSLLCKVIGVAGKPEEFAEIQSLATELFAEVRSEMPDSLRREPVILVLDKHMVHLPFESCPMFRMNEVTRMPCIALLLAQALLVKTRTNNKNKDPFVLENPSEVVYCVNPGKDLINSEERFRQEMQSVLSVWRGRCGEPLPKEEFKEALTSNSVYLYCGHGTGRQHMREQIEFINIRAVPLIFGCSSGKVRTFGKMDGEGYAFRLLMGGAPAIVANLWDVTDRDIDIFTYTMLRKWLYKSFPGGESSEPQLGAAVNQSRDACRLKALIGFAPVVYGLPYRSFTS